MNENYVLLLDIYGRILAKTQFEALDLRYNSDLSLAEIAEEMGGISRQSVNDFIKRGKKRLLELESVLGNAARFRSISGELQKARTVLEELKGDYKDERLNSLNSAVLKIQEEIDN